MFIIFTVRHYACTVYAGVTCVYAYLSQVSVLLKWLNTNSATQRPRDSSFLMQIVFHQNSNRAPPTGTKCGWV